MIEQIYLAGGMSNLTWEEQNEWREYIKKKLNYKNLDIINPTDFYNYEKKRHITEREVMEFDLHKVRTSDLIIVNFNNPNSIGTAMELMLAKELKIPVVGLIEHKYNVNSWLKECCNRIFFSRKDLIKYVKEFYLYNRN